MPQEIEPVVIAPLTGSMITGFVYKWGNRNPVAAILRRSKAFPDNPKGLSGCVRLQALKRPAQHTESTACRSL